MTQKVRGVLEDSRPGLLLNDFSGGIVTDTGGLTLSPNQSPDALNVFAWEGNLRFRGGYSTFSTLPFGADGAFTYYDVNDTAHMVEWAGGNMYEVTTGSPVVIASGVYSTGETIAHAQLNGILYWSTISVPLRQWDGTTEQAVTNAGGTGVVPPPACSFLIDFNGSLVAVDYVVGGVRQRGAFLWSNVNDPHTWVGANTQTVGSNDGGTCVFALLMGVAQVGVSPTKQFMVGKNNRQIFLYEGALGSLVENAVSSPVGIMSGSSAVYMPTKAGLGGVMFLGDDSQFYLCNGIECPMASDNIKLLVNNLVGEALKGDPNARFNAIYNQRFQYYMCDFGNNTQLVYKWDTGAWWLFQGWPSGVYTTMATDNGLPSIFVAANAGGNTGVYQLAVDGADDNGSDISCYWNSPYIHGGKPERLKIFEDATLFTYNLGVQYAVTGYGLPRSDNYTPITRTLIFNDAARGAVLQRPGVEAQWDDFKWDDADWGGGLSTLSQPYQIGGMKGPLTVPSTVSKWAPAGYPLPFLTGAAQFRIAYNGGAPDFLVTSLKIAFIFRNENVGVIPYTSQGQVTTTLNKFTNTGNSPLTTPAPSPTDRCANSVFVAPSSTPYLGVSNAEYYYVENHGTTGVILLNNACDTLYNGVAINAFADSRVDKINIVTGAVTASGADLTSYQIQRLMFNPAETILYAYSTNGAAKKLTLYNPTTMATLNTVTVFGGLVDCSDMGISDDGSTLMFADYTTNKVYFMDSTSFAVTNITPNPAGGLTNVSSCIFKPGSTNVYLMGTSAVDANQFTIYEYTTGGALVNSWSMAASFPAVPGTVARPYPLCAHRGNGLLYGQIAIIASTGPTVWHYVFYTFNPATGLVVGTSTQTFTSVGNQGRAVRWIATGAANTATPFYAFFTGEENELVALDQTGASTVITLSVAGLLTSLGYAMLQVDYACGIRVYIDGTINNADFTNDLVTITGA